MKSFIYSFAIVVLFFAGQAFALDESSVQLALPAIFSSDEVSLNAHIDIRTNDTVDAWFEYGTDIENFDKKSVVQSWERGVHFMSEQVSDLSPETVYYYRAVVQVNGDEFQTEPRQFKTLKDVSLGTISTPIPTSVPVSIPDPDTITVPASVSNLRNPFAFFKRNKDKNADSEVGDDNGVTETGQEESAPREYQDDPVGGVVRKDSVYYDDDVEVLEYSDEYRNKFKTRSQSRINPLVIIFILLLAGIIFFLIRNMRKKPYQINPNTRRARINRLNQYRRPQSYHAPTGNTAPQTQAVPPSAYRSTPDTNIPDGTFKSPPKI